MKPVKILYCIDNLLRGGTELQLIGLIERLDPTQYQPYLLTIKPSDPALTPANCIHLAWDVRQLLSLSGIGSLVKLVAFLRKEKIDIVQVFFQDSTLFAGLAAYIARTPVRIACFRDLGFWLTTKQKVALGYIYKTMSGFICNANVVRSHFSHIFNIALDKMQVIRNGVDVDSLSYVEHSQPCQHVGIVGNMTRPVKRTDLFIKAAGIVNRTYPHIIWHILGDGHLRTELEQLAKDNDVFEQTRFVGRISDIPGYLEKLDIGIICSDSEGLSNALIEYMFKGVASIATDVGGNPELIEHLHTGLLVPPNNADLLASAILHLINNTVLRQELANNARNKVLDEYSWAKCLSSTSAFYNKHLQQSSR